MGPYHDRQIVPLARDRWAAWLDPSVSANAVFGDIDAMKLRSSLTLFAEAGAGPSFDARSSVGSAGRATRPRLAGSKNNRREQYLSGSLVRE